MENHNIKQKLCLIGKNISHSQSPALYNEYFKEHNMDYEYLLHETINLLEFIENIKLYNYIAFNVTMPYKIEIMKYLDYIDKTAIESESCNLVVVNNNKLKGYNTDGIGLFNSLINNNIEIKNRNMTIIGNGGAGKSIISSANQYGIKQINIINHELSDAISKYKNSNTYNMNSISKFEIIDSIDKLFASDIIINASNCGFKDDTKMPLPQTLINDLVMANKNFCFVDIIYNPLETNILKYIRSLGIKKAFNGESMLYHQFLENIKIIFGEKN